VLNQSQFHIFSLKLSQTSMKSSFLFLGIFIVCSVMSFDASAAKSFSSDHQKYKCETGQALSVSASSERIPVNGSGDGDVPKIDVSSLDSSLPTSFCIRSTQELFCLFEILFEIERPEHYRPPIPVALSNFFLHLFRVIISPNAP
jgi:hypothetical protein